jgi:hypothetical protein
MSDTLTSVIPFDVYELIIDNLAEDDEGLTTMSACSLVSHGFLPLARKHIFASVEINNPYAPQYRRPSPTVDMFVRQIQRTPEIVEYIRNMDYCITPHDYLNMSSFLCTLCKLTKLKSLSIWRQYRGLKWNTQNWPLRPALLYLTQLPTLSYLKLHDIENFPASVLIHGSSLKHLAIHFTDFAEKDLMPLTTAPLPPKSVCLREYTAGPQSASATKKLSQAKRPDGLPIVDFTNLTKVTANCSMQKDIEAIQTLLIQTEQLQNIDLTSKLLPLSRTNTN